MSHFAKRHYEAIATVMQSAHPGEPGEWASTDRLNQLERNLQGLR